MNPLNWLPFYNDEKEGEKFDNSLLVPLTVGVVSVVSSVLVGYRSGLLGRKQATSLIAKRVEEVENPNILALSREVTKRKSTSKMVAKPTSISSRAGAAAITPDVPDRAELVVDNSTLTQPLTKSVDHSKRHPTPTEPVNHELSSLRAPDGSGAAVHTQKPQTTTKRNKKSKQSHPNRNESELSPVTGFNSTETDPASWVIVTSKKVKQSTTTIENSNPKASKKKHKGSEGSSESKSSNSAQPPVSKTSPSPELSPSNSAQSISTPEDRKVTVSLDASTDEKVSKPSKSKSTRSDNATPHILSQGPNNPVTPSASSIGSLVTATPTGLDQQHRSDLSHAAGPTVPYQSPHPVNCAHTIPDPHVNNAMTSSMPSLPAARELVTQHLSAQISAKELECQLLRDEVIRLREEVSTLKRGALTKSYTPPICTDAETMTNIPEPTPPDSKKSKSSPKSAPNFENDQASSNTPSLSDEPRSHSPDSVLLITLQNEIARLAKEMKLSEQRNENMQARLATANKQISVAKADSAKQVKSLQQELETQTQRAQQSEDAQRRLENELHEVLQQLECTRRKAEDAHQCSAQQHNELELARRDCATLLAQQEQWERERSILVNEKDQLIKERETLTSTHQACLSELENFRCASEELRVAVHEAELRAQTLERDRSVVLGESHSRITQLEAQLAASHEQAQAERSRLQAVESDLFRLTAEADHLRIQLGEKEREVASWSAKCASLSQNLSELSERQSADNQGPMTPETIQSVGDNQPLTAATLALLEATTQTDPEPSAEFEPESFVEVIKSDRTNGLEISELRGVAVSPIPAEFPEHSPNEELEAQVAHYKAALDATEAMLSKLQNSVDEEEQRWRKALDASRLECEVLEEKLTKLETSLSVVTQERDGLSKKLNESESNSNLNRMSQSVEDDRSSVSSLSVSHMLDTVRFDETTPKPELIRLLNKFRYLVQVEHEALKKEQSASFSLQSQLDTLKRRSACQPPVSESAINGAHSELSLASDSELPHNTYVDDPILDTADNGSPSFTSTTNKDNHGNTDSITSAILEDPASKLPFEHHPFTSGENQNEGLHDVMVSNGLHSTDSLNGDTLS